MFTKYVGLVSQSPSVPPFQVAKIAAAIQKQLTRDFNPIWQTQATIQAFARLEDMPTDYWPIIIMDNINEPGAAGYHTDRNGQPYSLVQAGHDTSLTCSHECLEMLADPFGNRLVASDSIKPGQGRVNYLVEVCDPSEAANFAYTVNGILLSDFYTPHYFDPVVSAGTRYSFSGAIQRPKELLPGGYISWMLPDTGEWWQANLFGNQIQYTSLGILGQAGKAWRETIDRLTYQDQTKAKTTHSMMNLSFAQIAEPVDKAADGRALQLKEDIREVLQAASPELLNNRQTMSFLESAPKNNYSPLAVIRLVLDVAGKDTMPETSPLIRKKSLAGDLDYAETTFHALFISLTAYLASLASDNAIAEADLKACETVGDVVDLTETAL